MKDIFINDIFKIIDENFEALSELDGAELKGALIGRQKYIKDKIMDKIRKLEKCEDYSLYEVEIYDFEYDIRHKLGVMCETFDDALEIARIRFTGKASIEGIRHIKYITYIGL